MQPILVLRQVPHETAGTAADAIAAAGLQCRSVDLFCDPPDQLDLGGVPGLVVLGGPMNVDETDRYPFLAAEVAWLAEAVRRRLPTLGICLGAQLLAKALGARVYANGVKEIGWHEVELTPAAGADPLLAGLDAQLPVFQWHGDTFDLPRGAVHLAASPACRHQAFRFGPNAWGLQFHIEVTAAMIEDWLTTAENRRELAALSYVDPAAIRAAVGAKLGPMSAVGTTILQRFAALCRQHAARPR
jgi:GMP synthase (glutamine-hydrolysing)